MTGFKRLVATLAVAVPLAMAAGHASAEDQLKLAIGQINNWENQAPTLGQDAGIFKKHGLVLENVGTARRRRNHAAGHRRLAPTSAPASASPASCAPSRRARRCASWRRCSPAPAISIGT